MQLSTAQTLAPQACHSLVLQAGLIQGLPTLSTFSWSGSALTLSRAWFDPACMAGTPLEVSKRWAVEPLFYFVLSLFLLEFVFTGEGPCQQNPPRCLTSTSWIRLLRRDLPVVLSCSRGVGA